MQAGFPTMLMSDAMYALSTTSVMFLVRVCEAVGNEEPRRFEQTC
jgi:hypothetical protein